MKAKIFRSKLVRKTLASWSAFATLFTTTAPAFAAVTPGTKVLGYDESVINQASGNVDLDNGALSSGIAAFTLNAGTVGVIDWTKLNIRGDDTYDYGAGTFWNLVSGGTKSDIQGIIKGAGNVFVLNPAGIVFGASSQVNVGGVFAAAAMGMKDPGGFIKAINDNPTSPSYDLADQFTVPTEGGDIDIADVTVGDAFTAGGGIVLAGNKITSTGTTGAKFNNNVTMVAADKFAGDGFVVDNINGGNLSISVDSTATTGDINLMGTFLGNLKAEAAGDVHVTGDITATGKKVDLTGINWFVDAGKTVSAGTINLADKDATAASTTSGTLDANEITFDGPGTMNQLAGTIKADTINGTVKQTDGAIEKKTTALTFTGAVEQDGGTIGNSETPYAVTVTGALTQNAGTINADTLTLKADSAVKGTVKATTAVDNTDYMLTQAGGEITTANVKGNFTQTDGTIKTAADGTLLFGGTVTQSQGEGKTAVIGGMSSGETPVPNNAVTVTGALAQNAGTINATTLTLKADSAVKGTVKATTLDANTVKLTQDGGTIAVTGTASTDSIKAASLEQKAGTITLENGNVAVVGALNQTVTGEGAAASITAGDNISAASITQTVTGEGATAAITATAGDITTTDSLIQNGGTISAASGNVGIGGVLSQGSGAITATTLTLGDNSTVAGDITVTSKIDNSTTPVLLTQAGGTISTPKVTGNFTQDGGTLTSTGNLTVTGDVTQKGGTIEAGTPGSGDPNTTITFESKVAQNYVDGKTAVIGQASQKNDVTVKGTFTQAAKTSEGTTPAPVLNAGTVKFADTADIKGGLNIEKFADAASVANITQSDSMEIAVETLTGNFTQTAGTLKTTTVTGNFTQNGGTLEAKDKATGITFDGAVSQTGGEVISDKVALNDTSKTKAVNLSSANNEIKEISGQAGSLTLVTKKDLTVGKLETGTVGTKPGADITAKDGTTAKNITFADDVTIATGGTLYLDGADITQTGGAIKADVVDLPAEDVTLTGTGNEISKITGSATGDVDLTTKVAITVEDLNKTAAKGNISITAMDGTSGQTITFAGTTMAKTMKLKGGAVDDGAAATVVADKLDLDAGAVTLDNSGNTIGEVYGKAGNVTLTTSDNLAVSGLDTSAGGTSGTGGDITLTAGGTAPTITVTGTNKAGTGTVTFNSNTTISGEVAAAGITAAGTTTLTTKSGADIDVTGDIAAGTLDVDAGTVDAATITVTTLDQDGGTVTATTSVKGPAPAGTTTVTLDGAATLKTAKIDGTVTQGATIAGSTLSGATDNGNLEITGGITQTKGTVDVGTGKLTLGKSSSVADKVKAGEISANGMTLTVNTGADVTVSGKIDSTVDFKGGDIHTAKIEGDVTQASGTLSGVAKDSSLEITGVLTQNGGLVDVGTATLTLSDSSKGSTVAGTVKAAEIVNASELTTSGTVKANVIGGDVKQTAGTIERQGATADLAFGGKVTQTGGAIGNATTPYNVSVAKALDQDGGSIDAATLTLTAGGTTAGTIKATKIAAAGATLTQDGAGTITVTGADGITVKELVQDNNAATGAFAVKADKVSGDVTQKVTGSGAATVTLEAYTAANGLSVTGKLTQNDAKATVGKAGEAVTLGGLDQDAGTINASTLTLTAGGTAAGTAAGNITATTITTASGNTLEQDGTGTIAAGTIKGNLKQTAAGTVNADTFDGNVEQTAGTIAAKTASTPITFKNGDVKQTGAKAGSVNGDLKLDSVGTVDLMSTGNAIDLVETQTAKATAVKIYTTKKLTLGSVNVGEMVLEAFDGSTTTAQNIEQQTTPSAATLTADTLTINNAGKVILGNANNAITKADVTATDTVTLQNNKSVDMTVSTPKAITVAVDDSKTQDITLKSKTAADALDITSLTARHVTVEGGNAVTIGAVTTGETTVPTVGNLAVTGAGAVSVQDAKVQGGSATIKSTGSSVSLTKATAGNTINNGLTVDANTTATVSDTTVTAGGASVDAKGNATLNTVTVTDGNLHVGTDAKASLTSVTVTGTTAGDDEVIAGGQIDVTTLAVNNGKAAIQSTGDAKAVNLTGVTVAKAAEVNAKGDITLDGTINLSDTATIKSTNGNVTQKAGSTISVTKAAEIDANKDVTLLQGSYGAKLTASGEDVSITGTAVGTETTVAGDLDVDSTQSATLTNVKVSGSTGADVNAGTTAKLDGVETVNGDLGVTAGGKVTLANAVTSAKKITVASATDAIEQTSGTVTATAGDASFTAAGDVTLLKGSYGAKLTASGEDVSITGTAVGNETTVTGDLDVDSTQSATLTNVKVSGSTGADVNAGTTAKLDGVETVNGDLGVTAGGKVTLANTVKSAKKITVASATDAIEQTSGTVTATAGDASFTAAGDVTLLKGSYGAKLTASGEDVSITGTAVGNETTVTGDLDVDSTQSATLTNVKVSGSTGADVNAGTTAKLDGVETVNGGLTAVAQTGVLLDNNVTVKGDTKITTDTGDIKQGTAGALNFKGTTKLVATSSDVRLDGMTVGEPAIVTPPTPAVVKPLTVEAGKDVRLSDLEVTGKATIKSTGGKVDLTKNTAGNKIGDTLTIEANTSASVDNTTVDAGGMAVTAGTAVLVEDTTVTAGGASVTAGATATIDDATITAGDLKVTAGGDVKLQDAIAVNNGATKVTSTGGKIEQTETSTGAGTLTLVGGDATLTADNGNIKLIKATIGDATNANSLKVVGQKDGASADAVELSNLKVWKNLDVDSDYGAVALNSVVVGDEPAAATSPVQVGTLNVDAGTTATLTDVTATGNTKVAADGNVVLDDVRVGTDAITTVPSRAATISDLEARSVNGSITLQDTIKATGNGTFVSTKDDVKQSATGTPSLEIGGNLTIESFDDATGTASGDVEIYQGTIKNDLTVKGKSVTVQGTSPTKLTTVAGNLDVDAVGTGTTTGVATLDNVGVTGYAEVDATNDILLNNKVSVGGTTDLETTGGNITQNSGTLTLKGDAVFTADAGNVTLDKSVAVGVKAVPPTIPATESDITVTASGDVTVKNAEITGDAKVVAGNDATLDTVEVTGGTEIKAGGNISATKLYVGYTPPAPTTPPTPPTAVNTTSDLVADAGKKVTLDNVYVAKDADIDAGTDVDLNNTIKVDGMADIKATGGNIKQAAGSTLTVIGKTDITADAGAVTLDKGVKVGDTTHASDLKVTGSGDVTVKDADVEGSATLKSTTGAVSLTASAPATPNTIEKGLTVDAKTTATVEDTTVTAGGATVTAGTTTTDTAAIKNLTVTKGDLNVAAGGDVTLKDMVTVSNGNGTFVSTQGNVKQTQTVSGTGTLAVAGNAVLEAYDKATSTAGSDVTVIQGVFGGDLTAKGWSVTVKGVDITTPTPTTVAGNAKLEAVVGDATVDNVTVTGNADIDATSGAVANLKDLAVGGNLDVDANNGIVLDNTITVNGTTDMATIAATGNIEQKAGTLVLKGDASFTSAGSLKLDKSVTVGTTTPAVVSDLTATGNDKVTIKNANVTGNVTLKSTIDDVIVSTATPASPANTIGGTLTVDAAKDATVDKTNVTGNADIDAGVDATLTAVKVGDATGPVVSTLDVDAATGYVHMDDVKVTGDTHVGANTLALLTDVEVGESVTPTKSNLDVTTTTGDIQLTKGVTVTGNAVMTATDGSITQPSTAAGNTLKIGGNATFNADADNSTAPGKTINLTGAGNNDIDGKLVANAGGAITITSNNGAADSALQVSTVDAKTGSVDLRATGITMDQKTGSIVAEATGATITMIASGNNTAATGMTLTKVVAGNDDGTVHLVAGDVTTPTTGSIKMYDDGRTINEIRANRVNITANGGDVGSVGGTQGLLTHVNNESLNVTGNVTAENDKSLNFTGSTTSAAGNNVVGGALTQTVLKGNMTQTAGVAVDVTGVTTLKATDDPVTPATEGNITLEEALNDFRSTVNLTTDGNTKIVDATNLNFDQVDVEGLMEATGDTITEVAGTGKVEVNGTTHLDAKNGITLDNAINDFVGAVSANNTTSGNIVLRDANDIVLGDAAYTSTTKEDGVVNAAGNIEVTTVTGDIKLNTLGTTAAPDYTVDGTQVLLDAKGDIVQQSPSQTIGVDINGVAQSKDSAAVATSVKAGTLLMNAGDTVGEGGYIAVEAGTVSANAGTDANIAGIASATSSGLDIATKTVTKNDTTTVSSTGITTGGNVDVYTDGTISTKNSGGQITAGGDVTVAAADYDRTVDMSMNGKTLTVNSVEGAPAQQNAPFDLHGGNMHPEVTGTRNDMTVFIDGRYVGGERDNVHEIWAIEAFENDVPSLKVDYVVDDEGTITGMDEEEK